MIPEVHPPSSRMALPEPSAEAHAHSELVVRRIRDEIAAGGGWLPFSRYMELALYAPGLGYYSAGARKLGRDGDFVTAPEISPLFGRTLARQLQQALAAGVDQVLEVGAGSGALAATLLEELERLGALPRSYLILELSADLRERSRDTLAARVPHLLERVAWLATLPRVFSGVILGNEVLDAMPADVVRARAGAIDEAGVASADGRLDWSYRPAGEELARAAGALALPEGYRTELQRAASAFVRSVGDILERGVALFVDYGFPAREYYHPQRSQGTLMCHYRHRAHQDPFFLPGLQDITTHIDFSAIARAAGEAGLEVKGYTSQAQFLINCGITEVLSRTDPEKASTFLPLAAQVERLTSPAEMGELFKVIAMARGLAAPLVGFAAGDRRQAL
jgi:SAM-dependent MidA family methyltransferase